jgi:hypothetical protein
LNENVLPAGTGVLANVNLQLARPLCIVAPGGTEFEEQCPADRLNLTSTSVQSEDPVF